MCLPSQIAKALQSTWDCACGGDTGVSARHGLSTFPPAGVVMAFVFTPGKEEIALLSSCNSWKSLLANLFPSRLSIVGPLRMFHGICFMSHMLSLLSLVLTGSSEGLFNLAQVAT